MGDFMFKYANKPQEEDIPFFTTLESMATNITDDQLHVCRMILEAERSKRGALRVIRGMKNWKK